MCLIRHPFFLLDHGRSDVILRIVLVLSKKNETTTTKKFRKHATKEENQQGRDEQEEGVRGDGGDYRSG